MYKQPTDEEALQLIQNLLDGAYDEDEQEEEAYEILMRSYPNILAAFRKRAHGEKKAENILAQAKREDKPILL